MRTTTRPHSPAVLHNKRSVPHSNEDVRDHAASSAGRLAHIYKTSGNHLLVLHPLEEPVQRSVVRPSATRGQATDVNMLQNGEELSETFTFNEPSERNEDILGGLPLYSAFSSNLRIQRIISLPFYPLF